MGELKKMIKSLKPVEVSKHLNKRQETSTRDTKLLLNKVEVIERFFNSLGYEIILEKIEK